MQRAVTAFLCTGLLFCCACVKRRGDLVTTDEGEGGGSGVSSGPLARPRRVTTSPENEFLPALSPDGRRLAYVSDRSGNLDIWLESLDPGVRRGARRLTFSAATDTEPAFSPDGERLLFTSMREDVLGDIYEARITRVSGRSEPELRRLTSAGRAERSPVYAPDGASCFFTAGQGERRRIMRMKLATRQVEPVGPPGGGQPAPSPDGRYLAFTRFRMGQGERSGGVVALLDLETGIFVDVTDRLDAFPHWGNGGKRLFFTRYADDTNLDGTIDLFDRPSVWRIPFRSEYLEGTPPPPAEPVTDSGEGVFFPTLGGGDLYFTRFDRIGADIWRLAGNDLALRFPTPERLFARAEATREPYRAIHLYRLVAGGNAAHFLRPARDPTTLAARARLAMARRFEELGDQKRALEILSEIIQQIPQTQTAGLARVMEIRLRHGVTSQAVGRRDLSPEAGSAALEALSALIAASPFPRVKAAAQLAKGETRRAMNDDAGALADYEAVLPYASDAPDEAAAARLARGDIFRLVGDEAQLTATYLGIIRDYAASPEWCRAAARRLVALADLSERFEERLARLREFVSLQADLPILPALAQNEIGNLYAATGRLAEAKRAYQATISNFPSETEEAADAYFKLAEILAREGNDRERMALYRRMYEAGDFPEEIRQRARQGYIDAALAAAEKERNLREWGRAARIYRELIAFDDRIVAAHRGIVACAVPRHKQRETLAEYRRLAAQHPENPAFRYTIGLLMTYDPAIEGDADPKAALAAIDRAIAEVTHAIRLDPLSPFPHQTLGWLLEQKDRLARTIAERENRFFGYARLLLGMALDLFEKEPPAPTLEQALESYARALVLLGDAPRPRDAADLYLNMGNGYFRLEAYRRAYHYYHRRLASGVPFLDPRREFAFYRKFGRVAFHLERYDEAAAYFKRAIEYAEANEPIGEQIVLYTRLALNEQDAGRYPEAIEYFRKAFQLNRKLGRHDLEAQALRNIAINEYFAGTRDRDAERFTAALDHFFESRDALTAYGIKAQARKGGRFDIETTVTGSDTTAASEAAEGFDERGELALVFTFIGNIYKSFEDYENAQKFLREKLRLLDRKLESHPKARRFLAKRLSIRNAGAIDTEDLAILTQRARILNNLGVLADQLHDFATARTDFLASLDLCRQLENVRGILVNTVNLGKIALQDPTVDLATLQETIARQEEALEFLSPGSKSGFAMGAESTRSPIPPLDRIAIENNLGGLFVRLAERWQGMPRQAPPHEGRSGEDLAAAVTAALRELETEMARLREEREAFLAEARNHFERALALARQQGAAPAAEAALLMNRALLTARQGPLSDEAKTRIVSDLEAALDLARTWHLPHLRWKVEVQLARFLPADVARKHLSAAVRALEFYPPSLVLPRTAWRDRTRIRELYERLVAVLWPASPENAFWASELHLAREIVFALRESDLSFADPELRALFREGRARERDVAKALARLHRAGSAEGEARAGAEAALSAYHAFLEALPERAPALLPFLSGEAAGSGEIRALLPERTALVKFFLLSDRILVWFLTREQRFTYVVEVPIEGVLHARAPGDLLFGPVAEVLAGIERLYVVPDRALWRLDFPRLPVRGKPLGEGRGVVHLPSATLLVAANRARNINRSPFLLFAVSDALRKPLPSGYVEALGRVLPLSEAVTGPGTGKGIFRERVAEAGIAQIEMPLSLHPVFPAKSALRFPDNGRGTSDLQAWEFPALSLRSHLLLFSDVIAPEGDDARARDLLLLSHLLVAAGAPTLMLERIPLDPAARQRFLSRFYPELPERSVAEAVTIAAASFPETPFLVIGFAGMDARESRRFARRRFREDSRAGVRAFQRKAWREAVAAFERTLVDITYLREDEKFSRQVLPRILPILYSGLVEALANLHEDTRAIFHQERYIALLEAQGDRGTAARERESLALLYARQGRYDKALAALEAAYRYVQKEGSTAQQVDLLARMAEIHERDGHYRRALEMLEAGKALAQEAGLLPLAAAQAEDIGRIYNLRLSAYTLAERAYREALHFYEQLDDPQKEALLHLKLSLTRQRVGDYTGAAAEIARARALAPGIEEITLKADLYEANLAWYEARYSRAEHLQRRVIERARRLGKRRIEIQALNLEGLIARRLGDPQRALEAHGAALALAEQLDDPIEMAASLNNLGVIHREGGRFTEALQAFRRALEIDEALHDRLGQAYDQRNIGVTDLRRGRLNEARRALETAIAISREVNDVYNLVNALYALGIVLERSGDLGAATAAYTETLEITRNAYLPEFQWRALYALGKLDRQGGNRNRAFSRFREAIGIVERLRAQVEGEAARSGFLEDKLSLYEEMVSLLLEKGDVAAALHYAERARSRNFIDILGRHTLDLEDEASTARLREAHRLESEIEALSAALARTTSEEERATLAAERSRAEAAYAALISAIRGEDRELSDLLSVEPVSLEELRAHLPPSTALVAYLVTPGAVVIWTLVRGELDVVRVAVSREELTALVVEFQQNLQRIGPVAEASEALYQILVAPVAQRISGIPTLCLVPHGILHNLSFAALASGGRYLIEDHAIFVVPSATVYALLSERPPPPRIERVLGVGNPDLGDPAFDLPFAQKEVLNLRRPFPTAEVFVREGATETLVKRRAPGHELIHLACHGFFDPRNPLDSKLKLRPDDANDGDLTAREIFGLDLGASLVTLSACQSGVSKITRGDEIIGFTRAFLYAGTQSVLVSLWRVNDVTTAILVKHLYRNLGRFDKAESLRRAQLAVKAYHPHPTYWAPFILVGLP